MADIYFDYKALRHNDRNNNYNVMIKVGDV